MCQKNEFPYEPSDTDTKQTLQARTKTKNKTHWEQIITVAAVHRVSIITASDAHIGSVAQEHVALRRVAGRGIVKEPARMKSNES